MAVQGPKAEDSGFYCDNTVNFAENLAFELKHLTNKSQCEESGEDKKCGTDPVYPRLAGVPNDVQATQFCKNDCALNHECTGFFVQKKKSGHEVCGFFSSSQILSNANEPLRDSQIDQEPC